MSPVAEERGIESETFDGALGEFAADFAITDEDLGQMGFADPEASSGSAAPAVRVAHLCGKVLDKFDVLRRVGAAGHQDKVLRRLVEYKNTPLLSGEQRRSETSTAVALVDSGTGTV